MSHMIITDDGKMFFFNPNDFRFVVNQKDVDDGKYEPKIETKQINGDKIEMRISQIMPPLVKIR